MKISWITRIVYQSVVTDEIGCRAHEPAVDEVLTLVVVIKEVECFYH